MNLLEMFKQLSEEEKEEFIRSILKAINEQAKKEILVLNI